MQGTGDDYIFIENFDGKVTCPESLCISLCDRHKGIGGYGIVLTTAFLILYLCSLDNFGVPIFAPFAPSIRSDEKDALYIDFITEMRERPKTLRSKNRIRQRIKDVRE